MSVGVGVYVGLSPSNKSHPLNADHLTISQQPSDGLSAITGLGVQPIILAKNILGITDINYAGVCTATIASGAGTLSGTTVSFVAGIATFTTLAFPTGSSPSYTLTFSSDILTPVTSNPLTVDAYALKAALSNYTALWDLRYNVVNAAGVFTSCDDATGTAGVPTLNKSTGSPAYSTVNKTLTIAGGTDICQTADSSILDTNPVANTGISFITAAAITGDSGFNSICLRHNDGNEWFGLKGVGGKIVGFSAGDQNPAPSAAVISPTTQSATRRLISMSLTGQSSYGVSAAPLGQNMIFNVWGSRGITGGYSSDGGSFTKAGTRHLFIGQMFGGTATAVYRYILILNHAETVTDRLAILRWSQAYHSVVEDTTSTTSCDGVGDSWLQGIGAGHDSSSPGIDDIMSQMIGAGGIYSSGNVTNYGKGSMSGTSMLAAMRVMCVGNIGISKTKKGLLFVACSNDMTGADGTLRSAQYIADNHVAMIALGRTCGYNYFVITTMLTSAFVTSTGTESVRIALNNLLRNMANGVDIAVADVAGDATLLANHATQPTIRSADDTHYQAAGYALWKNYIITAFTSIGFV